MSYYHAENVGLLRIAVGCPVLRWLSENASSQVAKALFYFGESFVPETVSVNHNSCSIVQAYNQRLEAPQ